MKRFAIRPVLTVLAIFPIFAFILWDAYPWIGRIFPGRLLFENGLEGRFFLPGWKGPDLFSLKDYLGVVVLPAATGLLFVLAGAVLEKFLGRPGRIFFLFQWLAGLYLVLSPDFHLNHRFSYL